MQPHVAESKAKFKAHRKFRVIGNLGVFAVS